MWTAKNCGKDMNMICHASSVRKSGLCWSIDHEMVQHPNITLYGLLQSSKYNHEIVHGTCENVQKVSVAETKNAGMDERYTLKGRIRNECMWGVEDGINLG